MLALAYLVLMVAFGDAISRPFLASTTRLGRLATAFLVGLLVSTWLTYLAALAFAGTERPLVPGNAVAVGIMAVAVALGLALRRRIPRPALRARRSELVDLAFIAPAALLVTWMMTTTLGYDDGNLVMAFGATGDFGATTAIAQSFAAGHNLPPEHPHWAGDPILYHFMYWFGVGNLTFLGLDPAFANNVLSIPSVVATLVLVLAFGERVFGSPWVGRIAAVLFFAQGSLSLLPWLASLPSVSEAPAAIWGLQRYLTSPFPYRGEDFGLWSQNVYITQRHLISAIGVTLVALLFVVGRLPGETSRDGERPTPARRALPATDLRGRLIRPVPSRREAAAALRDRSMLGYAATGVLLGLLPLWNSSAYVGAAATMAAILCCFRTGSGCSCSRSARRSCRCLSSCPCDRPGSRPPRTCRASIGATPWRIPRPSTWRCTSPSSSG